MRIKTDFVCVTDLEATCWEDKRPHDQLRVNEIIEIGSAMISLRDMRVVSTYQSFVKPARSPQLSDFCTSLTSITQKDVDTAPSFEQVCGDWNKWVVSVAGGHSTVLFSSWGLYDYKQLIKDCAYYVVPFPFRGDHLNLKEYVGMRMGWSRKGCGMGKALQRMGIKFEGRAHRGIDDAKMAAQILLKVGHHPDTYGDSYRPSAREVFMGYPRGN